MKSIALIANYSDWITGKNKNFGGGNTVANKIFNILYNRGYNITIICYGNLPEYKENNLTIKYLNCPIGSEEFTINAVSEAKKCDKTINFMTQNIFTGVILQSHSYLYRTTRANKILIPFKRFLYRKKINMQEKLFSGNIEYAYAVSEGIKNDFEKNFGIKNITVSYPGCERVYQSFDNSKNDILTFGLIANSSVNKGGHYTIFALGLAKLSGLKFKFKLIAPKYNKDILMKFLIKLFGLNNITTILPKQDDMSEFYKSIDCVIMPSIHEAFGLVPLEAMSFCKTCLVSDNLGFGELIDENSGFKFNRLSFISFIKSIKIVEEMFYNNHERFDEIRKNGWEISTKYSWERFVEGLIN